MYSIRGGGPGLYEFSIQISARPLTSGMVFALPRPSSGSSSVPAVRSRGKWYRGSAGRGRRDRCTTPEERSNATSREK